MKRLTRIAIVAAAVAVAAPLSGCAALLSAQQTANYEYNAGDGAWGTVGDVEARGVLLIQGESGDAQLFYTLINKGTETQNVTVEVGGQSFDTSLEAGQSFAQNPSTPVRAGEDPAEPAIISGLDAEVGQLIDVTVSAGGDEQVIRAQVLDGSQPDYKQYEPDGSGPSDLPTDGVTSEVTTAPTP